MLHYIANQISGLRVVPISEMQERAVNGDREALEKIGFDRIVECMQPDFVEVRIMSGPREGQVFSGPCDTVPDLDQIDSDDEALSALERWNMEPCSRRRF